MLFKPSLLFVSLSMLLVLAVPQQLHMLNYHYTRVQKYGAPPQASQNTSKCF